VLLTVLLISWTGSSAQTDTTKVLSAKTFLLNDTTICTSTDNVISTANRVNVLELQNAYLKKELVEERTSNDFNRKENLELIKAVRQTRRKLFFEKWVKKPVVAVVSVGIGYTLRAVTVN
jgi:mRNA degradation ribonuclease J1/J2